MDLRSLAEDLLAAAAPNLTEGEQGAIQGMIDYDESALAVKRAVDYANLGRWQIPADLIGRLAVWSQQCKFDVDRRAINQAIATATEPANIAA